jgi:hypothetical protein
MRIVNGISHSAQFIGGEGVQGGGVAKAGGEDGKIGEDCQIGEVRGVGVRTCHFSCF